MATRTTAITTCDFHNGDHDAAHTVKYTVNGRDYELDLCEDGVRDYHSAIGPWIALSRLVSPGKRASRGAPTAASSDDDLKAVRTWAAENGISISGRGRVPQAVIAQYRSAVQS